MKKIRLSYTAIRLFEQNRLDDLITFYFKLGETPTNFAMEEGKAWDKLAMDEVYKNKQLPIEFNGIKLNNPKTQAEITIPFKDTDSIYEITSRIDVFDQNIPNRLYELKTGSSKDSADYCNDMQVPLYIYLCQENGTPVDKGVVIHYDQMFNKTDMSFIWNTKQLMADVEEWVSDRAPKIKEYFENQGLI